MDTRELELFLSLAETLHFGQTGERMHLSASAVSRSIQRIEEELGQKLLERDKRSVRLTAAGEQVRQFAQEQLLQWRGLVDRLQPQQALRGEISLYCSVTAVYSLLSQLLSSFRNRYPAIEIKLHTGDQADAIERAMDGYDDLAIAALPEKLPKKLQTQMLAQSPLVFIAPAFPCAVSEMLSEFDAIDWAQVPLILSERGLARQRVDTWYRGRSLKPNIYAQVSGHEAIVSMVGLGLGVGVVPELVLANSPQREMIRVLDVQPPLAPFIVGLCATTQRLENPLVRAFWETAAASYPAVF